MSAPRATKGTSLKELTLRGIIIGGIITLLFTAANVYLGLKVGLTFATSIPAAVISMAVLRFWGDHTVQENNIVQTIASAAGTLSAVIFVLPGLVIVGWWSGFPYWQTMFVCAVGGSLGVMYSIPLRRALVNVMRLLHLVFSRSQCWGGAWSGYVDRVWGLLVAISGALVFWVPIVLCSCKTGLAHCSCAHGLACLFVRARSARRGVVWPCSQPARSICVARGSV